MHDQSSASPCACGCGQPTTPDGRGRPRRYVEGHYHPPRPCPICGAPRPTATATYCGAECRRQAKERARGRVAHPDGYIRLYRPGHPLAAADGYVLEHRLVVHEAGIAIPVGYHVHHINGIKDDNRLENLEVLPERAHHERHTPPGAPVTNQHGDFTVHTPEERRRLERERGNERSAAWKEANPERAQAYKRAYYEVNRAREIARVKAWKERQRAAKQADR